MDDNDDQRILQRIIKGEIWSCPTSNGCQTCQSWPPAMTPSDASAAAGGGIRQLVGCHWHRDIEKDSNGDPAANNGTSGKNRRNSTEFLDCISWFKVKNWNAFSSLRRVVPLTFTPWESNLAGKSPICFDDFTIKMIICRGFLSHVWRHCKAHRLDFPDLTVDGCWWFNPILTVDSKSMKPLHPCGRQPRRCPSTGPFGQWKPWKSQDRNHHSQSWDILNKS